MKKIKNLLVLFLVLLFSMTLCSGAWATTVKLKSIKVSPSNINLSINDIEILEVIAIYSDKSEVDVTDKCKYTNSNKKVISIDSDGFIEALNKGNSKITIKYGNKKKTINVSVTAEHVTISGVLTFMCDYKDSYLANYDICYYGQCKNPDKPQYITNIFGVPNDKIDIKDKSNKLISREELDQDGWFEFDVPYNDFYYIDCYFGDVKKTYKLINGNTEYKKLSVGLLKIDKVDELLGIED